MTTIVTMPIPKARKFGGNAGASKYNFASLTAGTEQCMIFDTVKPQATIGKLHSALGAYRKRGGEGKFTVRLIQAEGQADRVGVWRTA